MGGKLNARILLCALVLTIAVSICDSATLASQPNTSSKKGRIVNPAFANAGKVKGLEIWRVQNFEPVPYPKKDYGKFYNGDSYIVLNTNEGKDKKLSWDVHFWLGLKTSQDESGAAAIMTVQLDDLLLGGPIQHREVQELESTLFKSYFKGGLRYEEGGVPSGLKHVETNAAGEKRLFQVKGKKNIRVRQVDISIAAMNKGDCFILDAGREVYVYVGSGAKRIEKLKAISMANQIRDQDHNGRATVHIVDEFSNELDQQQYFQILGSGSAKDIPDETTAPEDGDFESKDERATTLSKVSDSTGTLKITPLTQKPLKQEVLDTNDCFVLDTGSGIYVWIGKKATQVEKTEAMSNANSLLNSKKYPIWTKIHRVAEFAESAPFKQYFFTWQDKGMQHSRLV